MAEHQISLSNVCIQSKIDNRKFAIDKNVIDSSTLLKNLWELTNINEPIIIDCPGKSLEVFINLINHHYQTNGKEHDLEFEKNLYKTATAECKEKLIKLIQDLCILDSDIFFNSIADYILELLYNNGRMSWNDIQEYLGLENDFTEAEREMMMPKNEEIEYFFSINTSTFQFPFQNKSVCSMKTDFFTPMNVLIARIIERSNAKMSRLLSVINKSIKNEVDRYPFKISKLFAHESSWRLDLFARGFSRDLVLQCETSDEKFFNIITKRKVIVDERVSIRYDKNAPINRSLNSIISKMADIFFSTTSESIYHFDVTKCCSPTIFYHFSTLHEQQGAIKFEEVYNHLIAKDLTKEIKLQGYDFFKFFSCGSHLRLFKKSNASKFYLLELFQYGTKKNLKINQEFKEFVTTYMEDDGVIKSEYIFDGICDPKVTKIYGDFHYPVLIVKKYLDYI